MTDLPVNYLFYPEETDRFLSIVTGGRGMPVTNEYEVVDELVRTHAARRLPREFSIYGKLHPVTIARAVFEDYRKKGSGFNLSKHEADTLTEVIRASFPLDPITGYYNNECMPFMVGLAHLFAQSPSSPPVCLVEGDIINLGGVNKFFTDQCKGNEAKGRQKSNLYIHEICRITRECIKREGGADVEVQPIRSGGDEVRLVIYGLEQEKLDTLLKEQVTPRIHELTAKLGLHRAPHTKVNEDKTEGAGIVFGCVSLNGERSVVELQSDLENQIKINKQIDGFLRNNLMYSSMRGKEHDKVYAEYVAHYINDTFIPYIQRKYPEKSVDQIVEEDVKELKKSAVTAKELWDKLISEGGYFSNQVSAGDTPNAQNFYDQIARKGHAFRLEFHRTTYAKDRVYSTPPFADLTLPTVLSDPLPVGRLRNVINAMAAGEKKSPFYKLAHDEGEIAQWHEERDRHYVIQDWALQKYFPDPDSPDARKLRLAVECAGLLDSSHPVSRCRGTRFLQSDAEMLLDASPTHAMSVVKIQLLNLSGLNNIDYELGNAVLRELGTAIKTTLKALPPPNNVPHPQNLDIYDCGNGVFSILLPSSINKATQEAVTNEIESRVHERITDKGILEFARQTMAYPREGRDSQAIIRKLRASTQKILGTKEGWLEKDWGFDEIPSMKGTAKGVDIICEIFEPPLTRKDKKNMQQIITQPVLSQDQLKQLQR